MKIELIFNYSEIHTIADTVATIVRTFEPAMPTNDCKRAIDEALQKIDRATVITNRFIGGEFTISKIDDTKYGFSMEMSEYQAVKVFSIGIKAAELLAPLYAMGKAALKLVRGIKEQFRAMGREYRAMFATDRTYTCIQVKDDNLGLDDVVIISKDNLGNKPRVYCVRHDGYERGLQRYSEKVALDRVDSEYFVWYNSQEMAEVAYDKCKAATAANYKYTAIRLVIKDMGINNIVYVRRGNDGKLSADPKTVCEVEKLGFAETSAAAVVDMVSDHGYQCYNWYDTEIAADSDKVTADESQFMAAEGNQIVYIGDDAEFEYTAIDLTVPGKYLIHDIVLVRRNAASGELYSTSAWVKSHQETRFASSTPAAVVAMINDRGYMCYAWYDNMDEARKHAVRVYNNRFYVNDNMEVAYNWDCNPFIDYSDNEED